MVIRGWSTALVCAAMCAACGAIVDPSDAGDGDGDAGAAYDAAGDVTDAAPPDAESVSCTDDPDCVGRVPGLGPCEEAACIGDTCGKRDRPNNSACEDGDMCTDGEVCTGGVCGGGAGRVCDNGVFCDGVETCNPGGADCEDGAVRGCGDTFGCTVDFCHGKLDMCVNQPNDGICDNGLFCDGEETCDPDLGCTGGPPPCNDGIGCTDDSCLEGSDTCSNIPNHGMCDDGEFCDGMETCDPTAGGCVGGPAPICGDDDPCTNDFCEFGGPGCQFDPICGPGDTCTDPFFIDTIPFSDSDDTTGGVDNYSYTVGECFPEEGGWGGGAPDQVWELDVPTDGTYAFELLPDTAFDSNLYVVGACASDGSFTCLGGNEEVGNGVREYVPITLFAGETVHAVVDGWGTGVAGQYDINVDLVGDTCFEPILADPSLPFTHLGNTNTTSNLSSRDTTCGIGAPTPGPEAVYSFTPPVTDTYEIRLSGAAPRPRVLYVSPACGAVLGCIGETGPGAGDQVLTLALTAGSAYFIYVDDGTLSVPGPYTLEIQTAP